MTSLSYVGTQMSRMSGLRSLMEDIATATAGDAATQWLNLSIGNPAAIPAVGEMWQDLSRSAVQGSFRDAGQYGPSRGTPALVNAIVDYFRKHLGWRIGAENVVIGPGSQMICFAAAALFGGAGPAGGRRVLLPAVPDYTGYQGLCMVPDGIAGVELAREAGGGRDFRYELDVDAVARVRDAGMMLASSPGNPTGRCLRPGEQDALIVIAERQDIPFFLDHAYGYPFPQVAPTLAPPVLHPHVVNCFSMSKSGLPGERIGFAIGPERYITPIVSFLANSVLHASRLAQATVAEALRSGALDHAVAAEIRPFYAARRELARALLEQALPASVGWRLHDGEGGMFAWLWVDEDWFDDMALYQRLKESGVFITPGRSFFVDPPQPGEHRAQCIRITLSVDEGVLREGIQRIGRAMAQAARPYTYSSELSEVA